MFRQPIRGHHSVLAEKIDWRMIVLFDCLSRVFDLTTGHVVMKSGADKFCLGRGRNKRR